jgi:hypothetical protein
VSTAHALAPLLAERRLWRAGQGAVDGRGGEPSGHPALDAALPGGGWPPAALSELLLGLDGRGELALLLPTLARATRQGRPVAVVGPPYLPYAPALAAAGLDLAHLLLVRAEGRDALWATEQALRSGACAAVLCWPQGVDDRGLRRLAVAAEQGGALGFAFRPRRALAQPSPAALRLEVLEDGAVRVHKCRGGAVPASPVRWRCGRAAGLATTAPAMPRPAPPVRFPRPA